MDILVGSTALITGGGSGMGQAIALEFEKEGAFVNIVGRTKEKLEQTVSMSKGNIHYIVGDVSDNTFVKGMFMRFEDTNSHIPNIIVNCAGVINEKYDNGELNDDIVIDINFMGTKNICSAAVEQLRKHKMSGSIINIASIAGHFGSSEFHSYAASKGAVLAYTKSLAMTCGEYGIRANTISPGVVVTPMSYKETPNYDDYVPDLIKMHPLGRLGKPIDIAKTAVFFASSMSEWITGSDLIVDGGYTLRE